MATIDAIKHRRSLEGLDATDALVITFGRQLWRDHKVTSDVFAKAKEMFGPHKLVDLILLMGTYSATAAMLTAVDMQLPPGKTPLMPVP
jgi:alkylhydroperoxidase family enzyme